MKISAGVDCRILLEKKWKRQMVCEESWHFLRGFVPDLFFSVIEQCSVQAKKGENRIEMPLYISGRQIVGANALRGM